MSKTFGVLTLTFFSLVNKNYFILLNILLNIQRDFLSVVRKSGQMADSNSGFPSM